MRTFLCFFILLRYLITINSIEIERDFGFDDAGTVNWEQFMKRALWTTHTAIEWIQPHLNYSLTTENISETCVNSLLLYFEGIKNWEPWAIKMVDATGRIPSGLMTGTVSDFGNFDECLRVRFKSNQHFENFQGKFCMIGYKIPLIHPPNSRTTKGESYLDAYGNPPEWISAFMNEIQGYVVHYRLVFGTCLPSICSDEDIIALTSKVTEPWTSDILVTDCQTDERREWTTSGIIALCILMALFGICVLGTALEWHDKNRVAVSKYYTPTDETIWRKSLKTFSLPTNSSKVFEPKKGKHFLDCIDGVRFFLAIWVILSHVSLFEERWKELKYTSVYNIISIFNVVTVFLENAPVNMENFSVISGFFLAYSMKKKMDKNEENINFIEIIFHKIWRLSPLFLLYGLLMLIIPNLHSGPIWNSSWDYEIKKCQDSWWMNMFFINNFVHNNNMCMLHSWFAGMLIQMQIAGLVVFFVMYRRPKIGMALASALISACILIVYETSLLHKFQMADFTYLRDLNMFRDWLSFIYFLPFNHFPSFVIGMALGWIMLTHKDVQLPSTIRATCWIMTILFYVVVMYGVWIPTTDYRIIAAYYALRTSCWGFSTSWVLFNLFTGHMEIIHRFLSLDVFTSLCRISYSLYVMHPLVLLFRAAALRDRVYAGIIDMLFDSLAIIVISIGLAYIAHITVESPFNSLYDLWYGKVMQEKTSIRTEKNDRYCNGEQKMYNKDKIKNS